jgi:hypothetical protein
MSERFKHFINRVLTVTGQQLGLCCHRDVGNIPFQMLGRDDPRRGRPR